MAWFMFNLLHIFWNQRSQAKHNGIYKSNISLFWCLSRVKWMFLKRVGYCMHREKLSEATGDGSGYLGRQSICKKLQTTVSKQCSCLLNSNLSFA